jgi:hypothetical protein
MRKFFFIFLSTFLFTSCDDGDVITIDLQFGDTFEACGDIVFFKIKDDPAESLSVQITSPSLDLSDLVETTINESIATLVNPMQTFAINGTSNTFNFRKYNVEPVNFFCNDVPPSGITITNDQESTTGEAVFTTILLEDDNDGIPAINEDINGNGDLTDDDTDGDGIPNYLDDDDDGDNVLTKNEDDNDDGDNNPFTNPKNTDGEDQPNYLDTDDDNDGVLTRDEENATQNQNPLDDFTDTNPDNANIPDFLNTNVANTVPATAYREHQIQQTFIIQLTLNNIQLETLTQDVFDFGTLNSSVTSNTRTLTPDFN